MPKPIARASSAFPLVARARRFGLYAVVVAVVGVRLARPAQAQDPGEPANAKFTKADFTIAFKDKNDKYLTGTALDTFFNRVNCGCSAPVTVEVRLVADSRSKFNSNLTYESKLRAGDDTCVCVGAGCGSVNCKDISGVQNAANLLNAPLDFKTNVRALFEANLPEGTDPSLVCDRDQAQSLWFWMDSNGDSDASTDTTDVTLQVQLDGRGPPSPTGLSVTPGNQALSVSWASLGTQSDLQGYQVLCSRGGDLAPFKGVFEPAFTIKSDYCPTSATTMTATVQPLSSADVSVNAAALGLRGPPPPALAALNPDFLCSGLLPNQVNARLFRLQNDIPYVVGVIAIDKRGNPSTLTEVMMETPKATQDFFTGYRSAGGQSEGGCALLPLARSAGASDAPRLPAEMVWGAIGTFVLVLRSTLRRRRARNSARARAEGQA